MKRNITNLAVVFGTLLVFGMLKVPFEVKMEEEMREKDLLPPKIDLSDRNGIGQAGYAAALGGFRDVLASYNYLKAYNYHAERDWYEMERTLNTVVTLQPRSEFYWEMAGWQLAYNTFSLTRDNQRLPPTERVQLSREYIQRGDEFLKRGLKTIPTSYHIAKERMRLYTDIFRTPDYDVARVTAEQLMSQGKMDWNQTLMAWGDYVYCLASIPGREYEAYVELKKLMSVSTLLQKVPAQRVLMYVLQDILMIPESERIADEILLFNGEELVDLTSLYNFESKVRNTPMNSVEKMYQSLRGAWERMSFDEKSDLVRAKIYFLQEYLEIDEGLRLKDSDLFTSAENKQYVIASLAYKKQLDAVQGDAYRLELLKKFVDGKSSRNERELLALAQLINPSDYPMEQWVPWGQLLFHKGLRYKELKNYWNARNNLYEKRVLGNINGIQVLPVGSVLSELQQLEKELDVPEEERITTKDNFTERGY